jgi:hypothetical protein
MILFHCHAVGGELQGHPLETAGVGWFNEETLPWPTAGYSWWGPLASAAIKGEPPIVFDAPREPVWRGRHDDE